MKTNKVRKLTYFAHCFGIFLCLGAAIWDYENAVKWLGFSIYLYLCGKFFGVCFKDERVKGEVIVRPYKELSYLNLRSK